MIDKDVKNVLTLVSSLLFEGQPCLVNFPWGKCNYADLDPVEHNH